MLQFVSVIYNGSDRPALFYFSLPLSSCTYTSSGISGVGLTKILTATRPKSCFALILFMNRVVFKLASRLGDCSIFVAITFFDSEDHSTRPCTSLWPELHCSAALWTVFRPSSAYIDRSSTSLSVSQSCCRCGGVGRHRTKLTAPWLVSLYLTSLISLND